MMKKLLFLCFALVVAGCSNSNEKVGPVALGPDGPARQPHTPVADRPDPIDLTEPGVFRKGTCVPTIIDTRDWEQQINRNEPFPGIPQSSSVFRPVKQGKPVIGQGPLNNLPVGNIVPDRENIDHGILFPGITQSPWSPPDPAIAVGPNHIVETVNMEIAFFSKTGEKEFQQRLDDSGDPGFFEDVGGGNFCFDPKCFFDHNTQRFFVLALEFYGGDDEAWITIAVSDDDDPHGIWHKYRTWAVVEVGDTTYWCDYPGLGFDSKGIYITNNLFILSGNGSGFGGVLFRAFDFAPLLNGDPAEFFDVRDPDAASVQCAQCFGDNPAPLFVSQESNTQLRVQAMEDPFGTPSLTTALVDVPQGDGPPGASNIGGTISVVGSRIMNVHWRDGRLWAAHAVASTPTPGSTDRAIARWYEIDSGDWPTSGTPVLRQSGEVDLGDDIFTFFPAIYTDDFGHAVLVYGKSAPDEPPGIQAVGRHESDPLGEMGAPNEFVPGVSGASGRWGDYFDICIDPVSGGTFWMVGEFQDANGWGTAINSFTVVGDPGFIVVTGFDVVRGKKTNDSELSDMQVSDDEYFRLRKVNSPGVSMIMNGLAEGPNPSSIQFKLEARVNTTDTVTQTVELFNYETGDYDVVSTAPAATTDTVVTLSVTNNANRYVDPDTLAIQARVAFIGTAPRFRMDALVDQAFWTISN